MSTFGMVHVTVSVVLQSCCIGGYQGGAAAIFVCVCLCEFASTWRSKLGLERIVPFP
jgi:predicted nucleic acid binding AN1-type Zn finger protein